MAYIKPGTVIKGYIWTGKRWVKNPERTADKVRVKKEIDQNYQAKTKTTQNFQMKETNAMAKYPGGTPEMAKSKSSPTSGSSSSKGLKGGMRPVPKSKPKNTGASTGSTAKTATPSTNKTTSVKNSSPKSTAVKKTEKKMPTVSQSNTMWVKKGDVVNGETVKKGYVAQRGKPERKVNANVKLVVDTARGKAGSKVAYSKGRAVKKGK